MIMKNPHAIWAAVAIIFMVIAGGVTLAALDKDPAIIFLLASAVATPVLGAMGVAMYQKLEQIKEISNGNLAKAQENQQATQAQLTQLALNTPPPVVEKLDLE